MSAFFVTQRVRVVRPRDPINMGTEGMISHVGSISPGDYYTETDMSGVYADCVVAWDRPVRIRRGDMHVWVRLTVSRFDQLEPVVPDGLESIGEINALYEPSPETVRP